MLIKTLSVPLSKQSRLWFHQSKLSLFRPFLFSSKLGHTTSPDLLLVIEARKYESTSFSLLKDSLQRSIHSAIVSIFCKALRRMSGLQDAVISSCTTWYCIFRSRIFLYNCLPPISDLYTAPKLSHVDFSFPQSRPFHKALDIDQKANFGQKKLALNKTKKSVSRVRDLLLNWHGSDTNC